jgi:hypothetical protein
MSRRWVNVAITEDILRLILAGSPGVAITSDWPADAQIVAGNWSHDKGLLILTITSSIFDEVPTGNVIPDWNPTVTAHAVSPSDLMILDLYAKLQKEEELDAVAEGLT